MFPVGINVTSAEMTIFVTLDAFSWGLCIITAKKTSSQHLEAGFSVFSN